MSGLLRLLVLLALVASAQADERILAFHSDIHVHADGAVSVVETIRVRAEGRAIRRGIYRDLPTEYRDGLGNRVRIGFELEGVMRNGLAEPHHERKLANGVRIYAGSQDRLLAPGEYEYTFSYRVSHVLGFFDDHDELYWNVTGNGWSFPIEHASATIALPATVAAQDIRVEGYTGAFGSTGQAYEGFVDTAGRARIATTRRMPARHGLTAVVSWPRGHVEAPTTFDEALFLLRNNLGLAITLSSAVLSLIYLLSAWRKVGRDPPPGVIFPHYEPPEGYSPASIRYVSKLGYDKKAFTVAVLNLAVQGFLTIDKPAKKYSLQRSAKARHDDMAPGEAALLEYLFATGNRVLLDNANHAVVGQAMRAHEKTLESYHHKRYFVTNGLFILPSVLLVLGGLLAVALLEELTLAVGVVTALSVLAITAFAYLLKAPTLLGRKLLDRVEGFKMYLEVAEKEDLALRNPPELTPRLFEAYLPYALALGVEQRWAEQFAEVFRRLRDERGADYQPGWYTGRGFDVSDPVGFADTVGDSLASAISSAARPPGSSSGAGGGGSSGGGGGGGGGGGW